MTSTQSILPSAMITKDATIVFNNSIIRYKGAIQACVREGLGRREGCSGKDQQRHMQRYLT